MPLLSSLARHILAASLAVSAGIAAAKPVHVPVYKSDFPDPFVIEHDGAFIAYSTNSAGVNLPMISSTDLVNWRPVGDPARPGKMLDGMPELAPWVEEGRTWAPEVLQVGNQWLLYYTARDRERKLQCIGGAAASSPRGPFRDTSRQPLLCQDTLGGTIDANPFRDADGKLYLTYKNDGNAVAKPTHVWSQRLSEDGLSMVGEPAALITNDRPWEEHLVEASSMVRTPDGIALFYSANHYGWETHQRLSPYAMGYAMCKTPLGPCTDAAANPILYSYNDKQAGCLSGPGHQAVFRAQGGTFIAFHAWAATKKGCRKAKDERYLYIAPFGWENGKPVVAPSLRRETRERD